MAISWGSYVNTSTNGMRLGYEFSQSPSSVGSGTSSVTVTCRVYVQTKYAVVDSTNTFAWSGSFGSGSTSVSINHGSNGGQTLIRTFTRTVSTSYSGTVSSSISVSLTGINAIPGTCRASGSHSTARRPYAAPKAPTGMSLTLSGDHGVIRWTRNPTTGQPYTSQELQVSINGAAYVASATLSGTSTSHTTGTFSPNSTYRYRLRAVNSSGSSAWAYTPTVRRPPSLPAAPTGATVTRGSDTSQTIRWTNHSPTSSTAPYQKVQIQRWRVGTGTWATIATLTGAPTSYVDKSTTSNERYRYRVRAYNTSGYSGFSTTDYVSTTPAAPTGIKAVKNTDGNIVVTWSLASVKAPSGVEIWRTADGVDRTAGVLLSATSTQYVDTAADPSQTWSYRVRAIAGSQSGDAAPTLYGPFSARSNTVQLLTNPLAPTGLAPASEVRDGTEDIVLTWQHNEVDGTAQTAFEVQHQLQGSSTWETTGKTTSTTSRFTLPAGTYDNGERFRWRVRTWGQYADPSPFATSVLVTLSTAPSVTITAPEDGEVVGSTQTGVAWDFFDPEGDAQAQWRATLIRADGETLETRTGTGTAGSLSRFNTRLDDGQNYTLQVEALDSTGLWSEPSQVTVTVEYPLPMPPDIRAEFDHDTGTVSVVIANPPADAEHEETVSNELWRSINGAPWELVADGIPTDIAITDYIPALGTGNYYKVVAISELPSKAESTPVIVDTTDHRWWVWVNAGPGFSNMVRVRDNAEVQTSRDREKVLRAFAGRTSPVEYVGEQRNRTVSLSARLAPDSSTGPEIELLADLPAPACIRTPAGHRYFVSTGAPQLTTRGMTTELSWSFTEVDYREALNTTRGERGDA